MRTLDDTGEVATPRPSDRRTGKPFVVECRIRERWRGKIGFDGRSLFWEKGNEWHRWKVYATKKTALRVIELQNRKLVVYEYRLKPEGE